LQANTKLDFWPEISGKLILIFTFPSTNHHELIILVKYCACLKHSSVRSQIKGIGEWRQLLCILICNTNELEI